MIERVIQGDVLKVRKGTILFGVGSDHRQGALIQNAQTQLGITLPSKMELGHIHEFVRDHLKMIMVCCHDYTLEAYQTLATFLENALSTIKRGVKISTVVVGCRGGGQFYPEAICKTLELLAASPNPVDIYYQGKPPFIFTHSKYKHLLG